MDEVKCDMVMLYYPTVDEGEGNVVMLYYPLFWWMMQRRDAGG